MGLPGSQPRCRSFDLLLILLQHLTSRALLHDRSYVHALEAPPCTAHAMPVNKQTQHCSLGTSHGRKLTNADTNPNYFIALQVRAHQSANCHPASTRGSSIELSTNVVENRRITVSCLRSGLTVSSAIFPNRPQLFADDLLSEGKPQTYRPNLSKNLCFYRQLLLPTT